MSSPRPITARFSRLFAGLLVSTLLVAAQLGALGLLVHAFRFLREAVIGGR